MNVTLNELLREGYGYQFGGRDLTRTDLGLKFSMRDTAGTPVEFRPEAGDVIAINYSMTAVRNNQDTVINKRAYQIDQVLTLSLIHI